jgi:single-strand DNA-binding protein
LLNQVVLIGHIGRDPELKYTPNGTAVTSFSLAVTREFKNKTTGEKEADWFNIVCWKKQAEFVANWIKKGRLVSVVGRLQSRSWVAQDGSKRVSIEVIAEKVAGLDKPKEVSEGQPPADGQFKSGPPAEDEAPAPDEDFNPFRDS